MLEFAFFWVCEYNIHIIYLVKQKYGKENNCVEKKR